MKMQQGLQGLKCCHAISMIYNAKSLIPLNDAKCRRLRKREIAGYTQQYLRAHNPGRRFKSFSRNQSNQALSLNERPL